MLEELIEANEYINSKIDLYKETKNILKEIEEDALKNSVPIISKDVVEYLKFIIETNVNIKNILEIGTATGYSGIIMLDKIIERDGSLTSIEIDENRYKLAKKNFEKSGLKAFNLIEGDALDEIKKIDKKFDLIFIDAAKGQYKNFFEDSYKLLNSGGIIFIDNILFRGYLYKQDYPKKYKTIVKRLDDFINYLYENYTFVLLTISDGVGLVYKK